MTETAQQNWPEGFAERLDASGFQAGWAKPTPAMWPAPKPTYVPALWRYEEAIAALTSAAAFVSTEFAERRNLILANPIPGNTFPTCRNLVAAYQLVLPGETARSHRHSPNALRLIVDADEGVYTLVEGVEIAMAPGDVLLTPSWHWHGHANHSSKPAIWMDFLDVPLVQSLENMYFEHYPDFNEPVTGRTATSPFRKAGTDLAPLAGADSGAKIDEGLLNTIGLHVVALGAGEAQSHPPLICNNIYAVTSGEIRVEADRIGSATLARGDAVVIPSWHEFTIAGGAGGGTLLRVTDAPLYEKLMFRDVARD
jgi:gentisate 1,2-dioxygenase